MGLILISNKYSSRLTYSDLTALVAVLYLIRFYLKKTAYDFDLYDPEHGGLKHILEQHPFLGVDKLVVAVLEYFVAVDILDVEVGVETEPLLVIPLILELSINVKRTPFSRFSYNGSNSS